MDQPKTINYNFFHWGPFLYKNRLNPEELEKIRAVCMKGSSDYRFQLAGLIKKEIQLDVKKLFPILSPYLNSYARAYEQYAGVPLPGNNMELISCWVNYMTKFESNPLHTHDDDLSFVIYTKIPKELRQEVNETVGRTKPGEINFIHTLGPNKLTLNQHTFLPEVGNIFIFPAHLHHCVNHFQSEGERISVSGNLKITKK